MYTFSLTIRNIGPIIEYNGPIKPLNLIVGPNASGKSFFAKTLLGLLTSDEEKRKRYLEGIRPLKNMKRSEAVLKYDNGSSTIYIDEHGNIESQTDGKPLSFNALYIPDTRLSIKYAPAIEKTLDEIEESVHQYSEDETLHSLIHQRINIIRNNINILIHEYINLKNNIILDKYVKYNNLWNETKKELYKKILKYLKLESFKVHSNIITNEIIFDIIKINKKYKIYIKNQILDYEDYTEIPNIVSGAMSTYMILSLIMMKQSMPGDIAIVVEEPEQEAHPLLQITVAYYLYRLVKEIVDGEKRNTVIVITTHSRYFLYTLSLVDPERRYVNIVAPMQYVADKKKRGYIYREIKHNEPVPGIISSEILLSLF